MGAPAPSELALDTQQKDGIMPDERTKPDDSGVQVKGQVNKLQPESDPIGINCEGGITTNEEGDPPGSELEVLERRTTPDQLAAMLSSDGGELRMADANPSNRLNRSKAAKEADATVGDPMGLSDKNLTGNPEADSLSGGDPTAAENGKSPSGGTARKDDGPDGSTKSTGSAATQPAPAKK